MDNYCIIDNEFYETQYMINMERSAKVEPLTSVGLLLCGHSQFALIRDGANPFHHARITAVCRYHDLDCMCCFAACEIGNVAVLGTEKFGSNSSDLVKS